MRSRREPLIIFGSARSAGVIERMIAVGAVEVAVVDLAHRLFHLRAHAGQHAEQARGQRAHLADRLQLVEEVLEGEACRRR